MGNVPVSGTVKIGNLVSKLKAQGADIISLSMGEPDFETPDNIREAAKNALDEGFTHYTSSRGIPELREAVADKSVKENNIPCNPDNVLITTTKHSIFMSMLAMVDKGDEVIFPDPAWPTYDACVRLAGGKPVYQVLKPENEYRTVPEDMAELITSETSLVVINSPSNPSGGVLTEEDLKGIADLAKDHDLTILSDEVYENIIYEGEHHSIASLDGMFDRTITVNGFSKTYAMTGWRLGWMVAPPHILDEVAKLQSHSITCSVSFAQKGGVEALTGPQDSVKEMVKEFKARRDLIYDLVDDTPFLSSPKPRGAFYILPSYDFEMKSEDLVTHIVEKANVGVTPGTAFGPNSEGHFRISYAASREDLKKAMERIRETLSKL